ncbi:MAG: penicillin-binding protein 2 [Pseudomonadota bacterium]
MIEKDNERAKQFSRRAFVLGALQGGILCVLAGRLAWLQIAEGNRYKTLAENNRINIKMLAPSRGEIVDRFGVPLAVNKQNFRVLVTPEQTGDLKKALKKLHQIVELQEDTVERLLKQAKKSAAFVPLEIKDNLDWDQVAKIEVNLPDLPGLSIDVGEIRSYPFADSTAHMIGYVGAVNKKELADEENKPVLKLPGFRIGKTGIEKALDKDLRGSAGNVEMEVNVLGREVRELKRDNGTIGSRVVLSIDAELQRYTQERLAQTKSASAVIMDVHTGALYALSSHPGFDPNLFTRGISAERWEELLANPAFPLTNKAIGGQYPPGSTFKMVTALAMLEAGVVNSRTTVFCPGHYDLGKDRFHCWKRGGHGWVNMVSALAESCDTYFYKYSTEVGIDQIADMARRLGLDQKYGFELPEERAGLMPDKGWKQAYIGQKWQPGETVVASIGQGYILSTPMQLAVMTARLVNGGYEVKPWIIGTSGDKASYKRQWEKIGLSKKHLDLVKRGMNAAMFAEDGTARASQIPTQGMEMGGKTGTAQVKRITMADRLAGVKNEDLEWRFRHHALFVGYAPYTNPRYACAVVVEHGGGGSKAAAPIARDLLQMAQIRDPASTQIVSATDENFDILRQPPPKKPSLTKVNTNG